MFNKLLVGNHQRLFKRTTQEPIPRRIRYGSRQSTTGTVSQTQGLLLFEVGELNYKREGTKGWGGGGSKQSFSQAQKRAEEVANTIFYSFFLFLFF